jgi:hypothetical protein
MGVKCVKMLVVMVYLMMSFQVHSMFLFSKSITNTIAWPKLYQQKKKLTFFLCVMMVNGLILKVPFVNAIYFNVVIIT